MTNGHCVLVIVL